MRERADVQNELVMLRATAKNRFMKVQKTSVVRLAARRTGGLVVLVRGD